MPRIKKSGLVVCKEVDFCDHCSKCDHSKPHVYDGINGRCYNNCGWLDQKVDCVPIETVANIPNFS